MELAFGNFGIPAEKLESIHHEENWQTLMPMQQWISSFVSPFGIQR